MEEQEQVAESQLLDVFNMIKGNNPKSKNTVYVNFEDFLEAVKKYKPPCLKALADVAHVNRASAEAFEVECQEHFRNICESVA